VYKGLNSPDYNAPPELEGHELEEINWTVVKVLAAVAGLTLLGACLDLLCPRPCADGRPKAWCVALMISSYLLLIPGISNVIFSFDIVANIFGHRIEIHPGNREKSCTESMTGLVHLLYTTGSKTGAYLVVLYAMVVPGAKLLLLGLGELLRTSSFGPCRVLSRANILTVQHISKWASPDMFAYILLVHLVRVLDNEPTIMTAAQLDIGFSCFSVFCVCSTISSLGVSLPKALDDEDEDGAASRQPAEATPPLLVCVVGRRGVVFVAAVLGLLFSVLFSVGLQLPCMGLRIDESQLYPPNGPVPYSAKPVVEALAIPDLLNSDVSLWSCIEKLLDEVSSGEANSVFALIMFLVFVVVLSAADVLVLIAAALRLRCTSDGGVKVSSPQEVAPCPLLATARVLRKLSMLDVAIMGVYVITFCLTIYKKHGIIVSTGPGLPFLLAAEVLHIVIYWSVSDAVEYAAAEARVFAVAAKMVVPASRALRASTCGSCTMWRALRDSDGSSNGLTAESHVTGDGAAEETSPGLAASASALLFGWQRRT